MKRSWILATVVAAVLAAAAVFPSQAQVISNASIGWGWAGYGPYWSYWYGWSGSWSPCGPGACIDNPYLRRAIQREIARLEYLSEQEERAQRSLQSYARLPYSPRWDWPPPTPEAHLQPAYHGSGEIRPEFSGTGEPRKDFAGALR